MVGAVAVAFSVLVGAQASADVPAAVRVERHPDVGPSTLLYRGHVMDVIRGNVSADAGVMIPATAVAVGFAAGSPRGLGSMGEFMVANGVAYTKNTDPESPDYYEVIHGPEFATMGAIFIPHGADPAATVTLARDSDTTMTLAQLYEVMFDAAGETAYVYAGAVEFAECHTLAVSRAPIFGEVIFEHRDKYYARGPQVARDVPTLVMGAGADFARESDLGRVAALERILYRNPYDTTQTLSTHSHALILREAVAGLNQLGAENVVDVNHLLAQSVVRGFRLEVYPIGRLEPLPVAAE